MGDTPFTDVKLSSIDYRKYRIVGQIKKTIQNIHAFHDKATHKREMVLDLGKKPTLTIQKKNAD